MILDEYANKLNKAGGVWLIFLLYTIVTPGEHSCSHLPKEEESAPSPKSQPHHQSKVNK
jgi:hypothetical protein